MVLLGAFYAELDNQPLTRFGSAKTQGLLAFLAMTAGQPHARAVLATMFWPEENQASASHNLRQAIYHLRRLLEPAGSAPEHRQPALLITRQTIQFNPDYDFELDVNRFVDLLGDGEMEQAADLYRGDLLAGLTIDNTPFEDWQRLRREQLHQQALDLFARLAERYLDRDRLDKARHFAQRQLEMEPWSELAHQQLMRALWMGGERSAALAQFEACRRILAAELGVEPQAETIELGRQIRAGLPAQRSVATATTTAPPLHNLRAPLTNLVGRDSELSQINALLAQDDCRLVTITGLGGIGKTQLVLAAARAQLKSGWDEISYIALPSTAVVDSPEALAHSLLQSLEKTRPDLHIQGQAAGDALPHLWRHRNVLLVLDNCEVIAAGGEWLAELLRSAPGLKILAASRHRLNLRAEWVVSVEPLSTSPEIDGGFNLSPAARLFVQRARQARPQFEVNQQNLFWINQICQQLDGYPLGVELAAARVRRFTTRDIANQLSASASTLSGDELDRPDRHRSLTAVFESSLALATADEQEFFRRQAVFMGGFGLDAAQEVAGAAPATIFRLVDRSLLRFDTAKQRFFRHPLVYGYALEKLLAAPDEAHAARARHTVYFAAFLDQRRGVLRGPQQAAALREIDGDLDNILAAWQWAADQQRLDLLALALDPLHDYYLTRGLHLAGEQLFDRAVHAIRRGGQAISDLTPKHQAIACALLAKKIYFLHARGHLAEVLEVGQQVDAADACPLAVRATVNRWWGSALSRLGRIDEARTRLESSLDVSRRLDDAVGQVEALRGLAHLLMETRDFDLAETLLEQAWALRGRARARDEWMTLRLRGYLAMAQGDFERASAAYQQALAVAQQIEDSFAVALLEERLGEANLEIGELATAHELLDKSVSAFRNAGAGEYEALALYHLGLVWMQSAELAMARQVLGEGFDLARALGDYRQAEQFQEALAKVGVPAVT